MRKAAMVLLGASALVAALLLLMSKGGGSGGRDERHVPGAAEEPAALPERGPAAPSSPAVPPWRAIGAAKGAARGVVEILLALDYDERAVARGEVKDGAFAVDIPTLGDLAPVLLGRAKLVACVDAPGFLPARSPEVFLKDREPGDIRFDVTLESGACVRGRAVDEAGRPVAKAEIWFSPREADVQTASDEEGRFVLPVRDASEYWLCARKGDVGVGVRGPLRLSPLTDFDAGDLVLAGPGVLSGVAVYPDGTPARRLDLHAVPANLRETEITSWPDAPFDAAREGPPDGLAWGWTTTDDLGRFAIRGLRAGSYFFREDKARGVHEAGSEVRVVVDLYRVIVRIVDERGGPAALDASARSDTGGSAAGRIDDLAVRPGERWTVTIGDLDLVPAAAVIDVVKERREYEVTLVARTPTELGCAQVTLLDPRGEPFREVRVSLYALPGDNVILFEDKLDATGSTPEVPAGRYRLEATPADRLAPYFPAEAEVDVRAGAATPVRLAARAGGRVQVTFKVAGAAPGGELPDVRIEARPAHGGEPRRLGRLLVKDGGGYVIGGRWVIGERANGWQLLDPGQYEIHIAAKGYAPLVVPALVLAEQVAAIEPVLVPEGR